MFWGKRIGFWCFLFFFWPAAESSFWVERVWDPKLLYSRAVDSVFSIWLLIYLLNIHICAEFATPSYLFIITCFLGGTPRNSG